MSTTIAILPLKGVDRAKQRLAGGLAPASRRALVEAMFADTLVALRRVSGLARIVVVSADRTAQRVAEAYGFDVLQDEGTGHSAAASAGIERAIALGATRVVLVPGDCPLLRPGEIEELLARPAPAPSVLIVPDRHGTGTNGLLLAPPSAIAPAFGPGSCERHAALAAAAGAAHAVVPVPSLGLDVDTPEDLDALRTALATDRGGAARTRGLLGQLDHAAAR